MKVKLLKNLPGCKAGKIAEGYKVQMMIFFISSLREK